MAGEGLGVLLALLGVGLATTPGFSGSEQALKAGSATIATSSSRGPHIPVSPRMARSISEPTQGPEASIHSRDRRKKAHSNDDGAQLLSV